MAAIIYYNRGVQLAAEKRFDEAIAAYFCALSLDPEFASAVKNVLGAFTNWSTDLSASGRHEDALEIIGVGLALAPEDATLRHNRKATWAHSAQAAIDKGRQDDALTVLRRAYEAVKDDQFLAMQAWVFIAPAEKLVEHSKWEEALAVAEAGLKKIDPASRGNLQQWRADLFARWSGRELDQDRFEEAARVLRNGLQTFPEDERLRNNLGYVAQQWAWETYQRDGLAAARSVLLGLLKDHTGVSHVRDAADNFARRVVIDLVGRGVYAKALAAVDQIGPLLADQGESQQLRRAVFDAHAQVFRTNQEREQALNVYREALEIQSDDESLLNNYLATWEACGDSFMAQKAWAEAVEVYAQAMDEQPGQRESRQNLGYCTSQLAVATAEKGGPEQAERLLVKLTTRFEKVPEVREAAAAHIHNTAIHLVDTGRFEAALATLARSGAIVEDEDRRARLSCYVYDRWADQHVRQQEWEQALELYREGLEQLRNDDHLSHNATVVWDAWAKTFIDQREWDAALQIYEQAVRQFPDAKLLKNNLEYCKQQQKPIKAQSSLTSRG